jgi:predicted permease
VFTHFTQDVRYALNIFRTQPAFAASACPDTAPGHRSDGGDLQRDLFSHAAAFALQGQRPLRPRVVDRSGRGQGSRSPIPTFSTGSGKAGRSNDWRRGRKSTACRSPSAAKPNVSKASPWLGTSFRSLGVRPILGTTFPGGAEQQVGPVVLSQAYWQRRFGADRNVLGRSIVISGIPFRVAGVMPQTFQFPVQRRPIDLWFTMNNLIAPDSAYLKRNFRGFEVMGVLKPSTTIEQAQAEMNVIASTLAAQYPEDKGFGVRVVPELENLVGAVSRPLMLLFVAVGALLLIACVNVANLLLAKAAGRKREMALRAALGATRGRLWAQLLTESVVLSIAASAVGSLLAVYALDSLVMLIPGDLPRADEIALDLPVLAFALGVSVVAGIMFGVAPAWYASRKDLLPDFRKAPAT